MTSRILTIGTILLTLSACAPSGSDQIDNGMMQDSFLPAQEKDINQLPEAKITSILEVKNDDTITLNPELVRANINGRKLAMYAYNGQFPGPTLKVKQGSTFTVNVMNNIDVPTTVHWHGIRLDNANDGVPGLTQKEIEPGGSFTYTVKVPDEGMFWYHPHVREDVQQDLGLYGNLWVTPKDKAAYSTVDSEEVIMLDDMLLEGGLPVPYGEQEADHALMGRFGNTMFVNGSAALTTDGQTDYRLSVPSGATIRFYLTNTANTRTFNLRFGNAKIKLVGGDSGRKEREEFVDSVILSPSERAIVEVQFAQAGTYRIESVSPEKIWLLGTVTAEGSTSTQNSFAALIKNVDVEADIDSFRPYFNKPVDKTIHLSIESMMAGMMQQGNQGGMQHGGMMNNGTSEESEGGVEWEDPMPQANAISTKGNTQWKLIDEASAKENMKIDYRFKVGDKVKIRLVNDTEEDGSDHPMQHPIHFHGQRFLVLSVDGVPNENLVWKDTVLVPKDATVDILLDITNPGDWMFHCHIAEHLSNGMMGMFTVVP